MSPSSSDSSAPAIPLRTSSPRTHLTPAAVYDAINFYYDHWDESDRFIPENTLEAHAEHHGFTIGDDGRLRFNSWWGRVSA